MEHLWFFGQLKREAGKKINVTIQGARLLRELELEAHREAVTFSIYFLFYLLTKLSVTRK